MQGKENNRLYGSGACYGFEKSFLLTRLIRSIFYIPLRVCVRIYKFTVHDKALPIKYSILFVARTSALFIAGLKFENCIVFVCAECTVPYILEHVRRTRIV